VSTYPIESLLRQWARGDLTTEQAIGHILQHLSSLQERIQEAENRLFRWEKKEQTDRSEPS
jgi:hypothetical protein